MTIRPQNDPQTQAARRRWIPLAALLSGTALTSPALAEDPTYLGQITLEAGAGSDEEKADGYVPKVSSGATLGNAPLVKTPVSVSVVTEEQIEDQGATSVSEALRYTPGVFSEYRGSSNLHDETQLRGFGSRTFVPKALDGMALSGNTSGQIDPYALESIEVIKGPNSIAFGQVTPGGMINMISKRPTEEQGNELVLSYGTDDYMRVSADLQGDLSDRLSYRLVTSLWQKNLQGDFDQNRLLFAPSLTWDITEATRLTVFGLYQDEPDAGQRGFFPRLGVLEPTNNGVWIDPDFVSYAPDYDQVERTTWALGYEVEHEFANGWRLKHNLRYSEMELDHSQLGLWSASDDGAGVYPLYVFRQTDDDQILTARLAAEREVVTGAVTHNLIFGVDYLDSEAFATYGRDDGTTFTYDFATRVSPPTAAISAMPLTAYTSDTTTTRRQTGVFAQDRMEVGNWDILAGLRYDSTRTQITENYVSGGGAGRTDDVYEDDAWSGRVGVSYEFANGLVPYLSYSTSFEPVTQLDTSGGTGFEPTTARQWEAGVKWASPQGNILLSAAYFDILKENIVESYTTGGVTTTAQIGEVSSKGIELEGKARLSDKWSLVGSYFNTDATYETGADAGNTFYAVPTETAALWLKYTPLAGLDLSLGARYVGSTWNWSSNDYQVPDYTLVDAGVAVDLGLLSPSAEGVKAALTVQNLTDERYVTSCVRDYCWLGEGRRVALNVSYDW